MFRWLLVPLLALALPAQDVKLQVLHTSDTHGHILPEDTYTLQSAPKGWARLATLVRTLRARNPHTLLLDTGDTLQGEPVNYVSLEIQPQLPEPMTAILRSLGCLAMVPGNHDFDWGLERLRQIQNQAGFPFLAANLVDASGKPAFPTHLSIELGGVRIAILGLLSARPPFPGMPGGPAGLRLADPVATARTWIPQLRSQEKADVVIAALHGGLGQAPCTPGDENVALCLAEQVPGLDLILSAHSHQPHAQRHNGIPILQPLPHGRGLGLAELELRKERGRWKLLACNLSLQEPTPDTPQDPEVLALTAPHRAATTRYLDTFATDLQVDLDSRWTRMEDTAVMQLLHEVQRRASQAQITAAASPGSRIFVPKGPTSVRQFWAFQPYEDRLARIRITGAQLRAYLEHAARFYNFSHQADLYNRNIPPYDFDILGGVDYALDLSRPVGSRVASLRYGGQPVRPDQTFTLALSTRRLANGGGYREAMNWTGEPEWISDKSLRNLLLERVLSRPTLDIPLKNHWRIIPFLDRERVMAQQP